MSSWDNTPVAPLGGSNPLKGTSWDLTPSQPVQQAPFEDPGFMQSTLIGAGRTTDRVIKGMQQLYYGATGDKQAQQQLAQQAADDDAAYAPLKQARPWATGIGESLPAMVIPAGGGATLGATVARQAIAGSLPGLLSYGSASDRLQNGAWGAAAGAAVPLAAAGVKTAWAGIEPFLQSGQNKIIGRVLNRAAGPDAQNLASVLAGAQPLVPGSMPTAAEAAQNGGIAALQRSTAAVTPQAYAERNAEQAAARRMALQTIAGTPQQLADAIDARQAAAGPLYAAAKAAETPVTPELQATLSRLPDSVSARAGRLARLEGQPLGLPSPDDAAPTVTGRALHYLKLGLDDELSPAALNSGGVGSTEQALLTGLKNDLVGQVRAAIPEYGQAMDAFAQGSRPINQMQVGQALYEKAAPALADLGALTAETPAKYAAALRNAEQTAKTATGLSNATLADVLEPSQLETVMNVGKDLARKYNADTLGRGAGSDTVQKLAMQNLAQQSGMPTVMSGLTKVGGVPLDWAYRSVNDEMAHKLANALLNPQSAANYMVGAQPQFIVKNPMARALLQQGAMRSSFLIPAAGSNLQNSLAPALQAE
jgi:hypothetical protein